MRDTNCTRLRSTLAGHWLEPRGQRPCRKISQVVNTRARGGKPRGRERLVGAPSTPSFVGGELQGQEPFPRSPPQGTGAHGRGPTLSPPGSCPQNSSPTLTQSPSSPSPAHLLPQENEAWKATLWHPGLWPTSAKRVPVRWGLQDRCLSG